MSCFVSSEKNKISKGICVETCPLNTFVNEKMTCVEDCVPPNVIVHTRNSSRCLKECPKGYKKER